MNMPISAVATLTLAGAAGVAGAQPVDGGAAGHSDNWAQRDGWNSDRDHNRANGAFTNHRADWDRGGDYDGATNASAMAAPEINPTSAVAALALLGGALIVLHGRYSIKPKA